MDWRRLVDSGDCASSIQCHLLNVHKRAAHTDLTVQPVPFAALVGIWRTYIEPVYTAPG